MEMSNSHKTSRTPPQVSSELRESLLNRDTNASEDVAVVADWEPSSSPPSDEILNSKRASSSGPQSLPDYLLNQSHRQHSSPPSSPGHHFSDTLSSENQGDDDHIVGKSALTDEEDVSFKLSDKQQQDLSTEQWEENMVHEAHPEEMEEPAAQTDDQMEEIEEEQSQKPVEEEWEMVDDVPPLTNQTGARAIISNINQIPDFEFPETSQLDKLGKASIGIAFSGGGARSASCTLGQLRGLHALGLIDRTRYFSSVSGSSWTLVPFLYGDVPREYFLGIPPADWKLEWNHIFSGTSHITEYMKHRRRKWIDLFVEEVQKMEGNSVKEKSELANCETVGESDDGMGLSEDVLRHAEPCERPKIEESHVNDALTDSPEEASHDSAESAEIVQQEIKVMLQSEERIEQDLLKKGTEELNGGEQTLQLMNEDKDIDVHIYAQSPRAKTRYVEIRTLMHRQYFMHHSLPDPTQHIPFQLENISVFAQFVYQLWNKASHYSYAKVLHDVFVKSFNAGDSTHYFSWRKSDVKDIVKKNGEVLKEDDFVTYNNEKDPFLIINGCMLNLKQRSPYDRKSYFEFTPLYVGSSKLYEQGATIDGKPAPTVGGVYCEPFLFNSLCSVQSSRNDLEVHVPLQTDDHRLSLCDIVACTSAAPAQEAAQRGSMLASMFPRFHYWTPWSEPSENALPSDQTNDLLPNGDAHEGEMETEKLQGYSTEATEGERNLESGVIQNKSENHVIEAKLYNFGDGGLLENTGMMGILKRQQKFMIVFLNTKASLRVSHNILTTDVSEDCSIPFGPLHYDALLQERIFTQSAKKKFFNYYPRKLKRFRTRIDYEINHVFKDEDGSKYRHLVETLYKKRMAGEAAICEDEYDVLDNTFYGIKGGWKCRVLWVYNDVNKRFEEGCLSPQLRSKLNLRRPGSSFCRFPHFRTVGENSKSVGGLKTEQSNLLSLQHTYGIMFHREQFLDFYRRAEEASKSQHKE